tara:strand:- start:41223 stop:41357 length:135 start_codon:yes stop_codon:yes gene_type:complete
MVSLPGVARTAPLRLFNNGDASTSLDEVVNLALYFTSFPLFLSQ